MLSLRNGSIALLALCACADTGTETDNPVIDFEASDCSSPLAAQSALSTVALTRKALTLDPALYNGLYCFAWEAHDDQTITIDVLNYSGSCEAEYVLAETRIEGHSVSLGLTNDTCLVGKCDTTCLYDFTYTLKGVDTSAPIELQLRQAACQPGDEDQVLNELVLPVDDEAEGIVCHQALYSAGQPACGSPHLPPCAGPDDSYHGTCEDGCGDDALACVHADRPDYDFCFTACESDDDCPIAIEACEDGACRLRETF